MEAGRQAFSKDMCLQCPVCFQQLLMKLRWRDTQA